jgi:hypothetical protein
MKASSGIVELAAFVTAVCLAFPQFTSAQTTPNTTYSSPLLTQPYYDIAKRDFDNRYSVQQKLVLQTLLTAAGYWNSVPLPTMSYGLYQSLYKFNHDQGLSDTDFLQKAFHDRLKSVGFGYLDSMHFYN